MALRKNNNQHVDVFDRIVWVMVNSHGCGFGLGFGWGLGFSTLDQDHFTKPAALTINPDFDTCLRSSIMFLRVEDLVS